ncbi:hypothetical protein WJX81_007406 [Elliptochloris bilobata]|uniref:PROP1-like PPR domain-containing protein n=1 Tax=Elliptochloris bilobata TaxID=381761 RepID=A0AAW1RDV5_9CHLO
MGDLGGVYQRYPGGQRGPYGGRGPPGMGGRGGEPERGQGYRKLWQQVTKVGRGQKLGEGGEAVPFSDMTVEDLLGIVRSLPSEESAVAAISGGLLYLDSRALAALLKELSKIGLANRAAELFDWLRQLPETHELAHLCDVYTYTTAISHCGSHQQLRKALEMIAEMRSRGIPRNVHTFSALMNVCIKANELELAIDVYKSLLSEGCTPNLVTFNTLIEVYSKTGAWQDAVSVLDALEAQGTKPETRTYNTIMTACNRSGQPESAMAVYERMLADGMQPTTGTYTGLITAWGKNGKAEEALQVYHDMRARGVERTGITYSSLLQACEKAGRWQLALELFQEMHRDGIKPSTAVYNALIGVCGQAGQWQPALDAFEAMVPCGVKPDAVTYGALIAAFDRGSQWCRALQALEEMQAQGHRPDVGVYNAVIEALSRSGVLLLQLKAAQLFQAAVRQGQLRMMPPAGADVSCIAFTTGTAVFAVLHWLLELRGKVAKNGYGGGPAPNPNPGQPERPALLLLKGKAGRTESPPSAIADAVTALLAAAQFIGTASITPQGVRVEVEVSCAAGWLEGEGLDALAALLLAAPTRKLPSEVLCSEDAGAAQYCAKAWEAVKAYEDSHPQGGGKSAAEDDDGGVRRGEMVGRLVAIARAAGLAGENVHDAVMLLDRLLRLGLSREAASPAVLAGVAVLSTKQGKCAEPAEEALERATGCGPGVLDEASRRLADMLGGDNGAISAWRILHLYLQRLGCDFGLQDAAALERVTGDSLAMMEEAVYATGFLDFPVSLVAAGVLVSARRAAGAWPFWPAALALLTGYDDPSTGAFRAVVECADALRRRRASALGRMGGLQAPNLAQAQQAQAAQAAQAAQVQQQMAASSQAQMMHRMGNGAPPASPDGAGLMLRVPSSALGPALGGPVGVDAVTTAAMLCTMSPPSGSAQRTLSIGAMGGLV